MKIKCFNSLKILRKLISHQVCCNNYRILKLFLLNIEYKETPIKIFKDRIKTFLRILKMPLYIKFKKMSYQNIVFITSGFSDKTIVEKYIHSYDSPKKLSFISNSITEPIYINSTIEMLRFMKYYLFSLKDSLFLMLMFNKISTKELSFLLYVKIKILLYKPNKLYIYSTQDINSNLLALFASNCKKIKVDMIIGFLEMKQRYGYYNNVDLHFISNVVKEQYVSYNKLGWIQEYNTKIFITPDPKHSRKDSLEKLYDVGFFSTAMWARSKNGRCYNQEEVQYNKKTLCNRNNSKIESVILNNLILLSKKHSFTLKIYLHPYEKELIEKFNIYPPYWDYNIEKNIIIDKSIVNNNILESKIGIVMISTIFYNRWEYNLTTLCFNPKNKKNFSHIPLKYLGKYSKYGFKNIKELEKKVLYQLKKEDNNELS